MITFPATPVTPEALEGQHYRPAGDFRTFLKTPSLPVLVTELASLIGHYVIGFKKQGHVFVPVVLTDIGFDRNLYVGNDGRWMARYLPMCLQNYPFCLGSNDAGEPILEVASDQLVVEEQDGTLPLFTEDGGLSEGAETHRSNLSKLNEAFQVNLQKVQVLADEGLIVEWPLKVRLQKDTDPVAMEGLYRIDPEKLLALGGDKLEELKKHGLLTFALSQPMSMQHTSVLMERASFLIQQERQTTQAPPSQPQTPSFDLADDDMISF